jgi:DNA mismatch endonuclease (patch repair protein)
MRRIKSKDMKPEIFVRSLVHRMGFRFRLHQRDLPGKPDLVFANRRKVIFVHGCFWHGHDDPKCLDSRTPRSNQNYWVSKLRRNKQRDSEQIAALKKAGWNVLVIWECETAKSSRLERRIAVFLNPKQPGTARQRWTKHGP